MRDQVSVYKLFYGGNVNTLFFASYLLLTGAAFNRVRHFWTPSYKIMRLYIAVLLALSANTAACFSRARRTMSSDPVCKQLVTVFDPKWIVTGFLPRKKEGCNVSAIPNFPLTQNLSRSRCAVVGGSPRINGSSRGAEVDSHDLVIRVNDHKWDPYDAGTKTDVVFLSSYDDSSYSCSGDHCPALLLGQAPAAKGCELPLTWHHLGPQIGDATSNLTKARAGAAPHSGMYVALITALACESTTLYGVAAGEDVMATFWNLHGAYADPGHSDILVNEFLVLVQLRRCGFDVREGGMKRFG